MSTINDLDFTGDESLDIDYSEVPEQFAAPSGPLYPGDGYVFQLPPDVSELWGSFEWQDNEGKKHKDFGLNLNRDHPLTVVKSPNGRASVGDTTSVYLNSMVRKRGRQGYPVSDLTYLQLSIAPDEKPKKKSDLARIISNNAGGKFTAEVQWQAQCRDDKDAPDAQWWEVNKDDPEGGGQWAVKEGEKGCGAKFYHSYFKEISAAQGGEFTWHNIECNNCKARLFPRVQLNRIRSAEK
jgi:hypothetical protein